MAANSLTVHVRGTMRPDPDPRRGWLDWRVMFLPAWKFTIDLVFNDWSRSIVFSPLLKWGFTIIKVEIIRPDQVGDDYGPERRRPEVL